MKHVGGTGLLLLWIVAGCSGPDAAPPAATTEPATRPVRTQSEDASPTIPRLRQAAATRPEPVLPRTFEEAVADLVNVLSDKDKQLVRSTPRDELIKFHHGWGMGIRNDFGLWGRNPELLKSCSRKAGRRGLIHPDDASMLIIEGVWDALQAAASRPAPSAATRSS